MKRIIFTLLYDHGQFMLSRNFRLQKVGNIDWLLNNYDLVKVSHGLDELLLIDVSQGIKNCELFCETIRIISQKCFIPLTAGGGIYNISTASKYLRSGADKLLLSKEFNKNPGLCASIAAKYGKQCIVGVVDYRILADGSRIVKIDRDTIEISHKINQWAQILDENGAGEIVLQCIDKDGTGMGLDLGVSDSFARNLEIPCILMGGVGKVEHIVEGLQNPFVDGVATANLFNFIGSTFLDIRESVFQNNIHLAVWEDKNYDKFKGIFKLNGK